MPSYGWDGTLTEGVESNKLYRGMEGGYRHVVWSGGVVSAGTGRAVNVAAIDGVIGGSIWFTESATTVALDANATTNPRIDYIVAEANWASNTVTITKVTGQAAATPTAPALTQNAGGVWQMPLARVTVAAGATSIAATAIEGARPLVRAIQYFTSPVSPESMRGSATSWKALGGVIVFDPGWPYRLQVSGAVRFDSTLSGGFMRIRIVETGTETVYGSGMTDFLGAVPFSNGNDRPGSGRSVAHITARMSEVLTGTHRLTMEMSPVDIDSVDSPRVLDHAVNHFSVVRFPA
jgi:hypothetical protein